MSELPVDESNLSDYRKGLLTVGAKPLSPQALNIIRCVDCVLSRFQDDDMQEPVGVLISDVTECTGEQRSTVVSTFRVMASEGFLAKQELPPESMTALVHGSHRLPNLFVPQEVDGESFFFPRRRPGCKRTMLTTIVESLSPFRTEMLQRMGQLATDGSSFTRVDLKAETHRIVVNEALDLFLRAGVIKNNQGNEYGFTERGHWLVSGLKPPKSPETTPQGVIEKWMMQRITAERSMKSHDLINALHLLIDKGVLEFSAASKFAGSKGFWIHNADRSRRLGFSELAIKHTTPVQRMAIVIWKELDLLLPKRLDQAEVAGLLGTTDLGRHMLKVVYPKLLQKIADERQQKEV